MQQQHRAEQRRAAQGGRYCREGGGNCTPRGDDGTTVLRVPSPHSQRPVRGKRVPVSPVHKRRSQRALFPLVSPLCRASRCSTGGGGGSVRPHSASRWVLSPQSSVSQHVAGGFQRALHGGSPAAGRPQLDPPPPPLSPNRALPQPDRGHGVSSRRGRASEAVCGLQAPGPLPSARHSPPAAAAPRRADRIPARAGRTRRYGCREGTKSAARTRPDPTRELRPLLASPPPPLRLPGGRRGHGQGVWPPEGAGPGAGGRGAGRSLAVEQEPPPFWFRCLGRSRAEAAAARSGSRPGPVPAGGREDAARRSPSSVPAVLSLTR